MQKTAAGTLTVVDFVQLASALHKVICSHLKITDFNDLVRAKSLLTIWRSTRFAMKNCVPHQHKLSESLSNDLEFLAFF